MATAIASGFAVEDRDRIASLLAEYDDNEPERVRLAILALADGDASELHRLVRAAQLDYRDVLYWAEYPDQSNTGKTREEMRARYAKLGTSIPAALR